MVMAVNNSALLTKVNDFSNLDDNFYQGQKLRQAYETRQQKKALNELMAIEGHNERMAQARQHRYAGSLVPELQKYEEERQKVALDNLKNSADIQKIYAESGKLGAETDEIQVKNAQGVSDYISAAAVMQDPTAFGIKIGELYKRGQLNRQQTKSLMAMLQTDPAKAGELLRRMAMGNVEIAKAFKPTYHSADAGDKYYGFSIDPMTGDTIRNQPEVTIVKGQSPDNYYDNYIREQNNIRTTNASMHNSDNTYRGTVYTADQGLAGKQYTADVGSQTNLQEAYLRQNKHEIIDGADGYQYIYYPEQGRAEKMLDASGQPVRAMNKGGATASKPKPASILKMENEYTDQITQNQHTLSQLGGWIRKIEDGTFNLGGLTNAGNWIANKTGINALGDNPQDYAEFNAFIKDLATKALRLNAGVQTDSDYKRQLEAMVAGDNLPRDEQTAIRLLQKMQNDFNVANQSAQSRLQNIQSEYGSQNTYGNGGQTANRVSQSVRQRVSRSPLGLTSTVGTTNTATSTIDPKIKALGDSYFK